MRQVLYRSDRDVIAQRAGSGTHAYQFTSGVPAELNLESASDAALYVAFAKMAIRFLDRSSTTMHSSLRRARSLSIGSIVGRPSLPAPQQGCSSHSLVPEPLVDRI